MSYSITVTKACASTDTLTSSTVHTVETRTELSEAVADAVTDQVHLLAIDISELQAFAMLADVAMTVCTNDAGTGSPQETFSLTANKAVVWETGDAAIFAGDITGLYVSNASGGAGTLKVIVGVDV